MLSSENYKHIQAQDRPLSTIDNNKYLCSITGLECSSCTQQSYPVPMNTQKTKATSTGLSKMMWTLAVLTTLLIVGCDNVFLPVTQTEGTPTAPFVERIEFAAQGEGFEVVYPETVTANEPVTIKDSSGNTANIKTFRGKDFTFKADEPLMKGDKVKIIIYRLTKNTAPAQSREIVRIGIAKVRPDTETVFEELLPKTLTHKEPEKLK